MPKYAKIQNAKRRRSRPAAVSFFNSPLGIWLLTAIFVTVGGAALSARQECLTAARSNIESFYRYSSEISSRRSRVHEALLKSSNMIDFQKALRSSAYGSFKEFDGRSLLELTLQQQQNVERFSLTKKTLDEYEKLSLPTSPHSFDLIMYGWMAEDVDDEQLKQARTSFQFDRFDLLSTFESTLLLKPACSFWRLMKREIVDDIKTVDEIPYKGHLVEASRQAEELRKAMAVKPASGDPSSGQPHR
jgi:hypothetical protein